MSFEVSDDKSRRIEEATSWFEPLYARADFEASAVPWEDQSPNPGFLEWVEQAQPDGRNKRALVVACGLGDDAVKLESLGFEVTAFDISPTAIDWARRRYPASQVGFRVANLFELPSDWYNVYDLVLEIYTIQALPPDLHAAAIDAVANLVAPGGTLLVVCIGRDPEEAQHGPPYPLTKALLDRFQRYLEEVSFEDYFDTNGNRCFRVEYRG